MKKIIINSNKMLTQVVTVGSGEIEDFSLIDMKNKTLVGNIYKGRVTNVLEGLDAAFVDIGEKKNAYLHINEVGAFLERKKQDAQSPKKISDFIREGMEILVQVTKDPLGDKGAKVSTELTVSGKNAVIMISNRTISISRKISDEAVRDRLKAMFESQLDRKYGAIIRTSASSADEQTLKEEISLLKKKADDIESYKVLGKVPQLIHREPDEVERAVRDNLTDELEGIFINDRDMYEQMVAYVTAVDKKFKGIVKNEFGCGDIFAVHKLNDKIEALFQRVTKMPGGGFLVFDETEALTVIDVNSGKKVNEANFEATAFQTNKIAAVQLCEQLRLREIGGIVIIDFIDMKSKANRKKVLQVLERELKKDKNRTTVHGFTALGLVEMTRKREGLSIRAKLKSECDVCQGSGRVDSLSLVASKFIEEVRRITVQTNSEAVIFKIGNELFDYMKSNDIIVNESIYFNDNLKFFFIESENKREFKLKFMGTIEKAEKFRTDLLTN